MRVLEWKTRNPADRLGAVGHVCACVHHGSSACCVPMQEPVRAEGDR